MSKGQFQKGQVPHNKGKKQTDYLSKVQLEKVQSTQFKKASAGGTFGERHIAWKGGIQACKRDGKFINTGPNERKRIARINYEEYHGLIPYRWVIYHLDQDLANDEISNLIAIPRAILISLNNGRLLSIRKDIELKIVKYLKLKKPKHPKK